MFDGVEFSVQKTRLKSPSFNERIKGRKRHLKTSNYRLYAPHKQARALFLITHYIIILKLEKQKLGA